MNTVGTKVCLHPVAKVASWIQREIRVEVT